MNDFALCSFQGRPALEIWPVQDVGRLWQHLHNGNGQFDWVMGFRDKATGAKKYARSKRVPVNRGISWGLATLQGRKTPDKSLSFVPYSTNADQMSRWGGFDFDAHDGEDARARRFAFDAWRLLLNCTSATIIESSGSGGWHVWAVERDFKPVAHWIRHLKEIAREIGAPIESGVCEIFPPDTLSRGFGKGLRAPGSWNPGTGTLSEIHWHNADALIAELPPCVSGKSRRIGEVADSLSVTSPIEKKTLFSSASLRVLGELIGGADCYRITKPATRRARLKDLVGAAFHQVSRTVAEQMARAQFAEKTVATNADAAEHAKDFAALWDGMEKRWCASLTDDEQEKLAPLSTDAQRSAFRIVRSYARKAAHDNATDFFVAVENLGRRLGITREGAGLLRRKLAQLGIITQTASFRANVAAARFRWMLGIPTDAPHTAPLHGSFGCPLSGAGSAALHFSRQGKT